jgi:enoyl-CoA hydratase/carnithine racemase
MTKEINVIFFAIFSVFLLTAFNNSGSNKTSEKELDLQKRAGQTADHKEGVAAFLEKRMPTFTGN